MGDLKKIKVKDLAVGLYVHLPGSWHTHPFLLSRFKIKSQQDIVKIMNLGYTSVMYDADLSEGVSIVEAPATDMTDAPSDSAASGSSSAAVPVSSSNDLPSDSQALDQYLETLQVGLRNYKNLMRDSKVILGHINAGRQEGVMLAEALTTEIAQLLATQKDAAAIATLMPMEEESRLSTSHALNVATLAMMVGHEIGIPSDQLALLGMGGLLHDIGEERVPRSIMLKRTPLNTVERSVFQLHPQYGEQSASQIQGMPAEVVSMIGQHHELLDGTGYPRGIKAGAITGLSGILSVIDRYDELTSATRSKSMTPAEALSQLYREQGTRYESRAVVALIHVATVYPPGSLVQLTNGTIGLVMSVNSQDRLRPLLAIYQDRGKPSSPAMVDLRHHPELEIARSLAYDQVSPEIQSFLNPQRLVGYFVCRLPGNTDKKPN